VVKKSIMSTTPVPRETSTESEPKLQLMLTKGDNNPIDDLELYDGSEWLEHLHVLGVVRG
jgi:signal peptidase I